MRCCALHESARESEIVEDENIGKGSAKRGAWDFESLESKGLHGVDETAHSFGSIRGQCDAVGGTTKPDIPLWLFFSSQMSKNVIIL